MEEEAEEDEEDEEDEEGLGGSSGSGLVIVGNCNRRSRSRPRSSAPPMLLASSRGRNIETALRNASERSRGVFL